MFDFLYERETEYESIVEALGLPQFVAELPYTMLGRAYHNSHHLRSVALNAYRIGRKEALNDEMLKTAFVAGVCHDLDYVSFDREPENIIAAVRAFENIAELLDFSTNMISYGSKLIRNTDTTIARDYNAQSSDDWIVHDADLSIWFDISAEEADYLCKGLEQELNLKSDVHTTRGFLESEGMGTLTGKEMREQFSRQSLRVTSNERWVEHV